MEKIKNDSVNPSVSDVDDDEIMKMTNIETFKADVVDWLNDDKRYRDIVARFAEGMSSTGITVRVHTDSQFEKPVVKVNWPSWGAVEVVEFECFHKQIALASEFANAAQKLIDSHA